ncbi:LPXTG-motif cell wall-anchored protein [Haloactinospora alba]|uniref:LPXTG-motif cell wall-anchored protein n=1 Tax=Haloactinospora alba TaxID=405555 RepID=A0A543NA81_9ACTN|nr:chaplin family protein [Haloactinospora alba]TQN28742.1 LPXTG-motif cell wall-anchored protein [Haloactinospora alba]
MRKNLATSTSATLLTAGLIGAAPAVALADAQTDGSGGVASGNQIDVPADVQAEICGNSVSALGISEAECEKVAEVLYAAGDGGGDSTDGSGGVASGNQINIPVDVAVDICGNAVGGLSTAKCTEITDELAEESDGGGDSTDGSGGVASGNQINIPVDVAVNVCGNSIAVLGASEAECTDAVHAMEESEDNEAAGDGGGDSTDGSGGVASGNQINIPADAAATICGNAVSVVGVAEAECVSAISEEEDGDDGGGDTTPAPPEEDEQQPPEEEPSEPPESDGPDNPGDGDKETPSPEPAPEGDQAADDSLPVTGASLAGWLAAAAGAVAAGAAAILVAYRRRRARAVAATADAS